MSGVGSAAAPSPSPGVNADARLRRVCHELEAVFLRQLFQVMRESTEESGLMGSTSGQDTFTALFDDQLAGEAAQKMDRGLGEALYRQISNRMAFMDPQTPGEGNHDDDAQPID
jgi:Rod binding domain-containing protein